MYLPLVTSILSILMLLGFSKVTTLQTMLNSLTVRDTPAHIKCYSYHAGASVIVNLSVVG